MYKKNIKKCKRNQYVQENMEKNDITRVGGCCIFGQTECVIFETKKDGLSIHVAYGIFRNHEGLPKK